MSLFVASFDGSNIAIISCNSASDSSSDSDLFPEATYTEDTPLKPEIASIGTKPKSQVISELNAQQLLLHQATVAALPTERCTIEDKIKQIQADADHDMPIKRPRGKDDPTTSAAFKRPKPRPRN